MPPQLPLDEDIMYFLLTNQKNVVELSLGRLNGSYLAAKSKLDAEEALEAAELSKLAIEPNLAKQLRRFAKKTRKPWPSKLRTLEMTGHVTDKRDFGSFTDIIRNSPDLKLFTLSYDLKNPNNGLDGYTQDIPFRAGRMSKMLHVRNVTTEDGPKFDLPGFSLQRVDLNYADRTFTKYIWFDKLNCLDLLNCAGAEKCLKVLTELFPGKKGNSLLRFSLFVGHEYEESSNSFDSNVLIAFLYCLKRLKHLTLDSWSITMPLDLKCLESHAETLE